MKEKTYKLILQVASIFALFMVFFVDKEMLFPFITSKQISFNILTELMFALWLVFVIKFPSYRPKKNLITFGLLAYLVAITVSLFVSVDPQLSFWGDAERMLGIFHVSHFFLFYLVILSVFKSFKEWKMLLLSSVLIATIVSLNGILGDKVYSTIGNTAYVSGYLIFNFFFAAILFFREKNLKLRWLYLLPVIIMLLEFWKCKTSGAIIGLFLSILLALFLVGVFHDNKKVKKLSLSLFVLAIISVSFIFSQNQASWFQNSFLKNLTPQKITFQTRLISWQAAAKDFSNHPVLGTGFGNYAIIFDRHFDSKFFNYTTSETYFDRAHNNLIDIVSTTGLLGLVTYLSIFVFVIIYLFRLMKENGWKAGLSDLKHRKNLEIIIIISLLAAYFIQNLAIFDSFVTYIGLMITLAYISWLYFENKEEESREIVIKKQNIEIILLIVFLLIAYLFTATFNLKPKRDIKESIAAYSLMSSGNFFDGFNLFKESLNDGPLDRDARNILVNLFSASYQNLEQLPEETADEFISFVIDQVEKNIAFNPEDSLMNLQYTQVLDLAANYYKTRDIDKYNELSQKAMERIDVAIQSSTGRAPLYFAKGQMLLVREENEKAIETVNQGISLNPDYYDGYCRLSQFQASLGKQSSEEFSSSLDKCFDLGGSSSINSNSFLQLVVQHYLNKADYQRAVLAGEKMASLNPDNKDVLFSLAKLYYLNDENNKSQELLVALYQKYPELEQEWKEYVEAIGMLK